MAYSTWISQSNRPAANYNSPQITVPANIDQVNVHLLVRTQDFDTTDKSFTVRVEIDMTGNGDWFEVFHCKWVGGPLPTPKPGTTAGWFGGVMIQPEWIGKAARVIMEQTGDFRWGLEGELVLN